MDAKTIKAILTAAATLVGTIVEIIGNNNEND